ncbi:MAG: hypothetical protein CSA96_02735 [Bacteroidetes bacterium]|nr:MAG: hypothetical protein CSA96_02735 [Bacteroidota bacterium]
MTNTKPEIKICMGSSCFSRGNKLTLQTIQQFLKDHELTNKVILKGNHCFGICSKGPIVQVGSVVYEEVNRDRVLEILQKELGT